MAIDWTKPIQTRDGREVRIWTREAKCHRDKPVRGEVLSATGWRDFVWSADGTYDRPGISEWDLVNVPDEQTVWVNVYYYGGTSPFVLHGHGSREEADESEASGRIACVPLSFREGEGLDGSSGN